MIRRLLCWIGWHEWDYERIFTKGFKQKNPERIIFCKHCRKVKK